MIGRIVSHYRILAKLGQGGMGVVYRAEDLRLGRTVALKFLPTDAVDDDDLARFTREARAAASLDHNHICHVYEIDETDEGPYIAMAYIDGLTLRERLASGPLPVAEALLIAIQVAEALAEAHAHGIVHRDIKPANILLTASGQVKIADFGLARLAGASRRTRTGVAVGTLSYMSPEQIRGAEIDARADLFSLGVVLYEMVTGCHPFAAAYEEATRYAIVSRGPPPASSLCPDVTPELDLVLERALAKEAARRYADAPAMLADLRVLRQRLVVQDRRQVPTWIWRLLGRRALALLLLPLLALGVGLLIRRGSERDRTASPLPHSTPFRVTQGAGWEGEPAISPDGNLVAYAAEVDGSRDIFIVDARGGTPRRVTDDPADDSDPTWFPDGASLAFVSERGGESSVWRTTPLGEGATLLLRNAACPAVSPEGGRLAVASASAGGYLRIAVATIGGPDGARFLTGPDDGLWNHRDPAWSPDGTQICYATQHDLRIVPASGGPPRALVAGGTYDSHPVWAPDARHIYFASMRGDTQALWRVGADGGEPERLTLGAGGEGHPSLARNGSRLAFATWTSEVNLTFLDLQTGRETPLPGEGRGSMPSFSPDGAAVAFVSDGWQNRPALWVQPLRDGAPAGSARRLNDQPGRTSQPAWSADGLWIAYYLIDPVTQARDVWVIPSAGGEPSLFTSDPATDVQPAWSPDGTRLAFVSDRGGTQDLWIGPIVDGRPAGVPRRITSGDRPVLAPNWSPDGGRIAFISQDGGLNEVWLVPAAGGAPAQLTHGAGAQRVRWDRAGTCLWVVAQWNSGRYALGRISGRTGERLPGGPPVEFGRLSGELCFDVARNGRLVAFSRERTLGDVWVLDTRGGVF